MRRPPSRAAQCVLGQHAKRRRAPPGAHPLASDTSRRPTAPASEEARRRGRTVSSSTSHGSSQARASGPKDTRPPVRERRGFSQAGPFREPPPRALHRSAAIMRCGVIAFRLLIRLPIGHSHKPLLRVPSATRALATSGHLCPLAEGAPLASSARGWLRSAAARRSPPGLSAAHRDYCAFARPRRGRRPVGRRAAATVAGGSPVTGELALPMTAWGTGRAPPGRFR